MTEHNTEAMPTRNLMASTYQATLAVIGISGGTYSWPDAGD